MLSLPETITLFHVARRRGLPGARGRGRRRAPAPALPGEVPGTARDRAPADHLDLQE
ncbi:hypothetical protein ACFSTC_51195 [Nonomuraea ferruginea]